ncbi:hypothetical protein [Streptomyces scopuliridis]|uniref:hypothetical protein n=1 Tax=Streptomyces scopuliridis TaxID=452529 RepID=UPI0035E1E5FF
MLSLSLIGVGATLIEVYRAYHLLTALDAGALGLGVVIGVSGIGGVIGALKAPGLVRRFGPDPVMLAAFGRYPVTGVPLLLAHSGPGWLGMLALTGAVQMNGHALGCRLALPRGSMTPRVDAVPDVLAPVVRLTGAGRLPPTPAPPGPF